jgi:hypothetical protein
MIEEVRFAEPPFVNGGIKRLKKEVQRYRIIAFDTEDDSKGHPSIGDYYDGKKHHTFKMDTKEGLLEMTKFIYQQKGKCVFVAHNLEYDLVNMQRDLGYAHIEKLTYVSRLIKAKFAECDHIFWDSFNWYSTSLRNIGKVVGQEKGDYSSARASEEQNIEYLHGDTEILWKFCDMLQTRLNNDGLSLQGTIASMSMGNFRTNYLSKHVDTHNYRETLLAYYGGRTEAFFIGKLEGDIRVSDRNSMYPSEMLLSLYPDTGTLEKGTLKKHEFGYGHFQIDQPPCPFPLLPVRDKGKLCFPIGRLDGWWTYEEVREAVKVCGAKIVRQLDGYGTNVACRPFVKFIRKNYDLRLKAKATKDDFGVIYYKLWMNTLYGKFAQHQGGTELWRDFPSEKEMEGKRYVRTLMGFNVIEDEDESPAKSANFLWGAYITAYSRINLHQNIMKVHNAGHKVVYCDTDSIFYQYRGEPGGPSPLVIGKELGEYDEEFFVSADITTLKAYRLVGTDGHVKIACKGVPSSAKEDFLDHGFAVVNKPTRLKESLVQAKSGAVANVWRDVEKRMRSIYSKRTILDDGNTLPLVMDQF